MKTIKVRWTRHAGHCWGSRDELISDVLRWTPSHGRAKAEWPAWTYIQQLSEDTGCSPEDLPEAMNDREEWRERVRDICAGGTTRWWWWSPLIPRWRPISFLQFNKTFNNFQCSSTPYICLLVSLKRLSFLGFCQMI